MNPSSEINLNEISAVTFQKLCNSLDASEKWRQLLTVLPQFFLDSDGMTRLEKENRQGSASTFLLRQMGNKGCSVGKLTSFLEELKLEEALIYVKNYEPVKIINRLPSEISTFEGLYNQFSMECSATGFPSPKYQWFILDESTKDWKKLESQQSSRLTIKPVRFIDAGMYCCGVFNANPKNKGEHSNAYSNEMRLNINRNINVPENNQSPPVIIRQPLATNKKAYQGSSIKLCCEAEGEAPIAYEWYRNGNPIPGEDKCNFTMDMKPINDFTEFTFQCRVSNRFGSTLSNLVEVSLSSPTLPKSQFMAEDKVALLFANKDYQEGKLNSAAFDATSLALDLREMDFKVINLINLTKREMERAIEIFSELIDSGVYVVFYYSGHGYQWNGQLYMLPIDVEDDCEPSNCLCLEYVLEKFLLKDPALCCMIMDTCRKDPPNSPVADVTYKPRVNRNTCIAFATTYSCSAREGPLGENGIYMKHLLKYITANESIDEVFHRVNYSMSIDPLASQIQFPELASKLGQPLKFTDKIVSKDYAKSELRRKYYEHLIFCEPSVSIAADVPGTAFYLQLEPYDEIVHNVLSVKILASSDKPDHKCSAVIKKIVSDLHNSALEQNKEDDCVHIYDIHKIKEPLKLEVAVNCKSYIVTLEYPLISKMKLWLPMTNSNS